ncbi:hypothetical protein BDV59DRAFT_173937 [Aspergillus ambiguus]|uniref:uncharacterized protein n=1 Tax=Aspergillus ambiguus TaxID=176160 RepID=UPI003CCD6C9A
MMPELDSHKPSLENPEPLLSAFSPWHACGPNYQSYSAGMARAAHLQLLHATCRLQPRETDTEGAARKWEHIFGVQREGSQLIFTNSRLKFTEGVHDLPEGLESIAIGVKGKERYEGILRRAQEENVYRNGRVMMVGVEWRFVLLPDNEVKSRI